MIGYDDLKVGEGRACLARFRNEFRNCMMSDNNFEELHDDVTSEKMLDHVSLELALRARDKRRASAARMAE